MEIERAWQAIVVVVKGDFSWRDGKGEGERKKEREKEREREKEKVRICCQDFQLEWHQQHHEIQRREQ